MTCALNREKKVLQTESDAAACGSCSKSKKLLLSCFLSATTFPSSTSSHLLLLLLLLSFVRWSENVAGSGEVHLQPLGFAIISVADGWFYTHKKTMQFLSSTNIPPYITSIVVWPLLHCGCLRGSFTASRYVFLTAANGIIYIPQRGTRIKKKIYNDYLRSRLLSTIMKPQENCRFLSLSLSSYFRMQPEIMMKNRFSIELRSPRTLLQQQQKEIVSFALARYLMMAE